MKKAEVIAATFSELKQQYQHQRVRGQGSSLRVAFSAAGRDLFKQPRLKRKRFTIFTAICSVGTAPDQE
jgi:hypothetical protein